MRELLAISFAFLLAVSEASQVPFAVPAAAFDGNGAPRRTFTLRKAVHLSLTNRSIPALARDYTPPDWAEAAASSGHSATQSLSSTTIKVHRASDQGAYQAARRASFQSRKALREGRSLSLAESFDQRWASTLEWDEEEIEAPDLDDLATLSNLAKMTSNAYSLPDSGEWYDLEKGWNLVRIPP